MVPKSPATSFSAPNDDNGGPDNEQAPTTRPALRDFGLMVGIFLLTTCVCLLLAPFRRPGGDTDEIVGFIYTIDWYYIRSPLAMWMHRGVYHCIAFAGLGPREAMALNSAMAGGIYLLALISISRHPLFLGFNLIAGTTFLFFGHLENYSWVNALLVLYFALVKRHLDGDEPLWPAAMILFLACLFHMLAVFTLPTIVWLALKWNPERRRPTLRVEKRDFEWMLMGLVGMMLFTAIAPVVTGWYGGNNGFERLVPLFVNPDPGHYWFTMFAWDHFKMLGYFHIMASPLGLLALLILIRRIRGRFQVFLLTATICGLGWTFIWHPDMHKGDWDLFSSFAFSLNILVGLLLAGLWGEVRRRYQKK